MNAEIEVLLQLMHTKGIGPRFIDRILHTLEAEGRTIFDFAQSSDRELTTKFHLQPEMVQSFHISRDVAARECDLLRNQHIEILMKGSPKYPPRLLEVLQSAAPPVIFVRGNLELLLKPAVGFCGSRKTSSIGIEATAKLSGQLALEKINIVSGYALGVDMAAHKSAIERSGSTTLVLAEGILDFSAREGLREVLTSDNAVIISQFLPNGKWIVGNAMQRNETICALSNAMVLIESGLTGGTFAAGKAALRLQRALFVLEYDLAPTPALANRYFLEHGARSIRVEPDGIEITELVEVVRRDYKKRLFFDSGRSLFSSEG